MVNSLTTTALQYLAIYLVHSTILLGCTWLLLRRRADSGHWVHDRAWKWAAAAGLMTTTFQMAGGWTSPILELPFFLDDDRNVASRIATNAETRSDAANDADRERMEPDAMERGPAHLPDRRVPASTDQARDFALSATPNSTRPVHVDSSSKPAGSLHNPGRAKDLSAASSSTPYILFGSFGLLFVGLLSIHGVVRAALQNRWWRRQLSQAEPARGRVRKVLRDLIRDAGIRRHVELFVSKDYPEPVAMGISRWLILLPEGIEYELTDEQLRALFAHELAHLIRRDPLWLWVGHGLCSLLAIQPLNFLARRRWKAAAEFVCDDWAIRQGVTRLAMAQCLTTVAEWRMNRQVRLGALAAGGSPASLPQRVERLLDEEEELDGWNSPWRRAAWSVAVLLTVVAFALFAPRFVTAGAEDLAARSGTAADVAVAGSESQAKQVDPDLSTETDLYRTNTAVSLTLLDGEIWSVGEEIEQLKKLLLKNERSGTAESVSRLDRSLKSLKVHYEALRALT